METKEQRIRRKFRKLVNQSPEFLNLDKKIMLDCICDWFFENKKQMTQEDLDGLIEKCKREEENKEATKEFHKLLVRSKEMGFH